LPFIWLWQKFVEVPVIHRNSFQKRTATYFWFLSTNAEQKITDGVRRQVGGATEPTVNHVWGLAYTARKLSLGKSKTLLLYESIQKKFENFISESLLKIDALRLWDWFTVMPSLDLIHELRL
jgi:hypothetical protein